MFFYKGLEISNLKTAKNIRKAFFWALLLLLVTAVFYARYVWQETLKETSRQALIIAKSTEVSIERHAINKLEVSSDDINKPEYEYLKDYLYKLTKMHTDKGLRFTYIFALKLGKVYFLADSEPPKAEDYSAPGQEYIEASKELLNIFKTGEELIIPVKDHWGNWMSVLVPIKDKTGQTIAVLGMDYPEKMWKNKAWEAIFKAIGLFFLLFLLLLTFFRILLKNEFLKEEKLKLSLANKKIADMQSNYQDMFNNSQVAMLLLEEESGKISYCNKAACEFYGYTEEKLKTLSVKNLCITQKNDLDADLMLLCEQKKLNVSRTHITAQQEIKEVEVSLSPLILMGERYLYAIITDVTERNKTEKTIEETSKNFKSFFDAINDLLFVYDSQGLIIYVNRTACVKLGYTEEELIGQRFTCVYKEEDREEVGRELHLMMAGKKEVCLISLCSKEKNEVPGETRIVTGVWSGQAVYFCVVKDITELKKSEEKFARAFHESPELIVLFRLDEKTIVATNQTFCTRLGINANELLGKSFREMNIFIDQEEQEIIAEALEEGLIVNDIEVLIRSKKGLEYTAILTARTFEWGNIPCWMMSMKDITNRKEIEKLLKEKEAAEIANVVKGQYLANMSHEIRTPINGIVGLLKLLQQTELNETQEEYVRDGIYASDALLYLINNILDFSKLEAGKLMIEKLKFNIRNEVEGIFSTFIPMANKKGIMLYSFIKKDVPDEILGDPARLRQILNNLLSNAMKFTNQGEIKVTLEIAEKKEKNLTLLFKVQDTGMGISKEGCAKLFKPFVQADNSIASKFGGTGLGLAISKELVNLMGGEIAVESVEGKGTTFVFTILVEEAEEQSLLQEGSELLAGLNILLVDGVENSQNITRSYLEEFGINVVTTEKGEDAIAELLAFARTERRFDLIISAFELSDMTGENLKQTVNSLPSIKGTQFLMQVPIAQKVKFVKFQKEENCYVSVPIKRNELLKKVMGIIGVKNNTVKESTKKVEKNQEQLLIELNKLPFQPELLLVEDNMINRRVLTAILENKGLKADIAENGQEAYEKCLQKKYDIILMDCQMPVMNGYEATRKIRESASLSSSEPFIIAMTANAMGGDKEKCLEAGMNDYVSKPIDFEKLFTIMVEYLNKNIRQEKNSFTEKEKSSKKELPETEGIMEEEEDFLKKGLDLFIKENQIEKDIAQAIFKDYVKDAKQLLRKMAEALNENNFTEVKGFAHQLKGTSGNLMINEIHALAMSIEEQSKIKNKTKCEELLKKVQEKFKVK